MPWQEMNGTTQAEKAPRRREHTRVVPYRRCVCHANKHTRHRRGYHMSKIIVKRTERRSMVESTEESHSIQRLPLLFTREQVGSR